MFLGGAPLNVACHLAKLGENAQMLSSVGMDFLGDEALRRARRHGVGVQHVSRHVELPTGTVLVDIDEDGNATYEFPAPVAWDEIPVKDEAITAIKQSKALIFGTLAMRLHHNRPRLMALLRSEGPLLCLDVNLRPPYADIELALKLANQADLVKLNADELAQLTDMPVATDETDIVDQCGRLKIFTGIERVCVTRGAEGAVYWDGDEVYTATSPKVEVRDTVGAGDAFMAALVHGLVNGKPPQEALQSACDLGAEIAGQDGAV